MIPQGEVWMKWNKKDIKSFEFSVKIPHGILGKIQLNNKTVEFKDKWMGTVE
jgi:uncharacterized protein YecE (DUF72 family)